MAIELVGPFYKPPERLIILNPGRLKAKLFSQVVAGPNGCWIWTGGRGASGYGYLLFDGEQMGVHRASHEAYIGPIPEGLSVLHSCNVRLCFHPAHLRAGTEQDNADDRVRSGRTSHFGLHGEESGKAILTEEAIRQIKELYLTGDYSFREIAFRFGVTKSAIQVILRGRGWVHSLSDNEASALTARRADRTNPLGEQSASAKLTNEQVIQIRSLYRHGYSSRQLARKFDIAKSTVLRTVNRITWRHLADM
jgi:predicted DNA-binding protein YlxM (UPF0122 family)